MTEQERASERELVEVRALAFICYQQIMVAEIALAYVQHIGKMHGEHPAWRHYMRDLGLTEGVDTIVRVGRGLLYPHSSQPSSSSTATPSSSPASATGSPASTPPRSSTPAAPASARPASAPPPD